MQKWSQPLIWGMVIAVIGPITASYFGLVFIYFGSLTVLGIAALLWILYFYAIYLLCTRPHDERFVQIYMLVMSILMLPREWCWFYLFASANTAHNRRVAPSHDETKEG